MSYFICTIFMFRNNEENVILKSNILKGFYIKHYYIQGKQQTFESLLMKSS